MGREGHSPQTRDVLKPHPLTPRPPMTNGEIRNLGGVSRCVSPGQRRWVIEKISIPPPTYACGRVVFRTSSDYKTKKVNP